MCLLGSAWIQSAFISGILISFDRFSLAQGFLILASPTPGWSTHITSGYARHLHPRAYSCSVHQFLTFRLWYPPHLSHIKLFPWKPKQRGTKRLCVRLTLWCRSCACVLHVSFAVWHFRVVPQTSLTGKPPHPLVSKVGNMDCSLCWLFLQASDRKEAVHPSEAKAYLNLSQK